MLNNNKAYRLVLLSGLMDHNQVLQPVSMDPSPCVDDFRRYSTQELREHLATKNSRHISITSKLEGNIISY